MSEPKFSRENLKKMIEANKDDMDSMTFVLDCIRDFEGYHQSIVEMESWMALYSYDTLNRETYQNMLVQLDQARHVRHNAVLSRLAALNRMAEQTGVGLIYDGKISEEKSFRRQAANAVLAYLEEIIATRQ